MATDTVTSASLLGNKVTRYEDVKNKITTKSTEDLGKSDFLALFTAQLKNQNPLDPVKNEAFVAQLAQFSQLEALTNMQGTMEKFVTSMSAEKMLGSTSLIGRKVSMADTPAELAQGGSIDANIELPQGASGVTLSIRDANGNLVQELVGGPQMPGQADLTWDGKDAMGNPAPAGLYALTAQAVVNGKNTKVTVNTLASVKSVATAADGSVSLQVTGGKTVALSDVKQVSQ